MHLRAKDHLVRPGTSVELSRWPTQIDLVYASKKDYRKLSRAHVDELSQQQDRFYASNQYSMLILFQAMDAAGKDGAIKHVMSGVNPQGCRVTSFKHPSPEELEHDFLWRSTRQLPERGMIGIFNRSYYEEVLIVRVHPQILASQNLPPPLAEQKTLWKGRFESINQFEQHLVANGTIVLKFFLHLSKAEQRRRFLARIDDPDKNWKFSAADVEERKFWPDYQRAYEACLSHTSTAQAPWHVVPADDKKSARLIVSEIILEAFRGLKLEYPSVSKAQRKELLHIRGQL